jgi:hypothetical protein
VAVQVENDDSSAEGGGERLLAHVGVLARERGFLVLVVGNERSPCTAETAALVTDLADGDVSAGGLKGAYPATLGHVEGTSSGDLVPAEA